MAGPSLLRELRKRKVVQAAAIYGAVAWGVTEVLVTVAEQLFLPQWIPTLVVIGFVVGFPVAMFLAWTFDITADGIRRTEVGSRRGKASIALSLLLLVAGTAGLFLLIKPSLQGAGEHEQESALEVLPNSIAVLPFENTGPDAADDYLSMGLSDELRDQLGRIAELRIAARSSSQTAMERGLDAQETSTSLRVAHLVEGSLRRQGSKLRVSVQLIEGRTGLALWSDTYDRGASELLNVQETIAGEIVRRILPETANLQSAPATRNADANELMLLAQYYERQVRSRQAVDVDKLREAVRLYRQAVEADPDSALAHSRLAGALLYLGDIDAAEAPIFRALSLNPNLSEVQNTLGEFYWARGRPEAAAAFARAVELNPHNADALHNFAFLIWMSVEAKQFGDPADFLRRAVELDPLSLERHAALGDYLGKEMQVDGVRAVIGNIRELFDDVESWRAIGWLHELIGETDRAIAWVLRARDREPDNPDHVAKLADLFALIGDAETALRLEPDPSLGLLFQLRRYQKLIDVGEFRMIEEPEDVQVRYLLAFAHVAEGQFESAIHVLGSAGLLDSARTSQPRSVAEIEASFTLNNALAGLGSPEATELARSLATWHLEHPWWGEIGWIALNRSCILALLDRDEEALQQLAAIEESPRLRSAPQLRDSWCFRRFAADPAYLEILEKQEERRAALRARLPATLAEFGVKL
jgi:TolB-like protein/thioredoxin-like negative regulator of GroEL